MDEAFDIVKVIRTSEWSRDRPRWLPRLRAANGDSEDGNWFIVQAGF